MTFNIEEHIERQKIIKYGREKWPHEKNINKLYEMAAKEMGVEVKIQNTTKANHLPTPQESAKENPHHSLVQICPECGKKAYTLRGLCRSCKDAEGGIYRTMFECFECKHKERSKEPMVVWLDRLGIDFKTQSKASLGIKTVTDDGLK